MNHADRERIFLDLFHANRPRIQRLCFAYLGSAADADDLFQEIMTNAWNSLPGFRGEASPHTWLYRVAVNTALLYRKKWKHGEELADLPDPGAGPHQSLEDRERLVA